MPSSKSVSFSTILHDCSHKERLIQKGWIFRAFPKQMYLCFWLFLWQTVHFSLLMSPIFFRRLSVDSPLCKNLKLKPISFVLFVHWKDNWFAVFQLIVMLISSSQFSWLGMGSSNFFLILVSYLQVCLVLNFLKSLIRNLHTLVEVLHFGEYAFSRVWLQI